VLHRRLLCRRGCCHSNDKCKRGGESGERVHDGCRPSESPRRLMTNGKSSRPPTLQFCNAHARVRRK
jgi:hypothetical protein